MRVACIDIGSNTTRLLVAERGTGGALRAVREERSFRGGCGTKPVISTAFVPQPLGVGAERIAAVAAVVAAQAARARELGVAAGLLRVVGTAAVRQAPDAAELCAAVRTAAGAEVEVLGAAEEARLAFAGATASLEGERPPGPVAVVDVGGGSCQVAVGEVPPPPAAPPPAHSAGAPPLWTASLDLGSALLAARWSPADPPGADALAAARAEAARAFAAVSPPACGTAVAIGGGASSLRRIAGPLLDAAALDRALARLTAAPAAGAAAGLDIAPERARLLPAAILLLAAASERLGHPLAMARGGLREGVALELLARG